MVGRRLTLILNLSHPKSNKNVPDPYFGGDEGFENVFNLLNEACEVIVESLKV